MLVISVGLCVYLLLGKSRLVFTLDGSEMYEALFEFRFVDEEIHRRLAYWLEDYHSQNEQKLGTLWRFFLVAAIAFLLQIGFWAIALASTM